MKKQYTIKVTRDQLDSLCGLLSSSIEVEICPPPNLRLSYGDVVKYWRHHSTDWHPAATGSGRPVTAICHLHEQLDSDADLLEKLAGVLEGGGS